MRLASVAPIIAIVALLLEAIGLFAVAARSATYRAKEIGMRMALGASAREIRDRMLWEAMAPVMQASRVDPAVTLRHD